MVAFGVSKLSICVFFVYMLVSTREPDTVIVVDVRTSVAGADVLA